MGSWAGGQWPRKRGFDPQPSTLNPQPFSNREICEIRASGVHAPGMALGRIVMVERRWFCWFVSMLGAPSWRRRSSPTNGKINPFKSLVLSVLDDLHAHRFGSDDSERVG